jgi:2-polyprenyl-6-methoxyphenol hydroxylase-like FAD-dependent oxidoreductase
VPQRFNSIAVVGAGAVGSFYGAMLARAGHRVTLIGRAAHVHAIEQDGLRLDMAGRVDVLAVLRCRRSFVQALRELGLATSGSLTGAPLTGGVSVSNSLSRRSTMSCRLSKRFSAMTDRTPPGPRLRGLDCEVEQVSRVSRRSFMRESA